jgi:hypothetical protein
VSTIPTVKAQLVSVLTAALPSTQIIYGPPVPPLPPRVLAVGKAIGTRELDSLSLETTAEQYTVELIASVSLSGADQQAADELVLADYAAAELAIREHPSGPSLGLSGTVHVLPTGEFELSEQADDNGRHAAVRFSVSVYAQNS